MRNRLVTALLLALPACAQLPSWAGAGASYGPHWSGWAALALPVSQTAQVYSFTMYQALPVTGKVPTLSTTTGAATILRTFSTKTHGTLYVLGLGTAGVSTTSSATTAAFSGGGGGVWRLPSGFTVELFAVQNKTGSGIAPNVLVGGGWTW